MNWKNPALGSDAVSINIPDQAEDWFLYRNPSLLPDILELTIECLSMFDKLVSRKVTRTEDIINDFFDDELQGILRGTGTEESDPKSAFRFVLHQYINKRGFKRLFH